MSFSHEWEQRYKDNTHLSVWPWSDIVSLYMRYCRSNVPDSPRILELGAGAGANIPFFLSLTDQFYGVDGSSSIVESLRTRYPSLATICK